MNDEYRLLRRIDLNLLVVFDALMRTQNVSRAAELCFLSQPAMSNALKRLRDTFDDPLLVRTSSGMTPSPRAEALIGPIRSLLNQLSSHLQPPQAFDPGSTDRQFRIALTSYGEHVLLPELTRQLNRLAPHAGLRISRLGEHLPVEALERGEVDLVVGVGDYLPTMNQLQSTPYLADELVCVARRQASPPKRLTLKRYLSYRHVYPSPLGVTTNVVDTWLDTLDVQRDIALTTHSYLVAARIVAESEWLLSLPRRIARHLASLLPLTILEPPKGFPAFQLRLVWHPRYGQEPGMRWLLGLMAEVHNLIREIDRSNPAIHQP